jgi:membrane protein implicated in regulation of membrane protease activity
MMERGARIIGMAAALVVAAFVLVFIALLAPSTRSWSVVIGIAYIVAGAVVLLAPMTWAGGAAVMTAVITGLFALVAFGNNVVDGLILLAASLIEAGAAWALLKQRDPSPRPEDR